jgi:hypothetical protein
VTNSVMQCSMEAVPPYNQGILFGLQSGTNPSIRLRCERHTSTRATVCIAWVGVRSPFERIYSMNIEIGDVGEVARRKRHPIHLGGGCKQRIDR